MSEELRSIKLRVGRAQLATALELFIRDKDPISVHSLACGGSEVIEEVAQLSGVEAFSTHVLEEHPHLDQRKLRELRNRHWNAFKHVTARNGGLRQEDVKLVASFADSMNDAVLFIGWWDYDSIVGCLPIEVQVFQVWWYAVYEEELSIGADLDAFRTAFPGIRNLERREQKRSLRRSVEEWRNNAELKADPRTEPSLHNWS